MNSKESNPIEKMDFETAFQALQDRVSLLEGEELTLEKALDNYEVGQRLARRCAQLLEEAELKMQQLSMETPSTNDQES